MSEEETEPEPEPVLFEAGVEDCNFDAGVDAGVEAGFGCVEEAEVGAGSEGFP